MKRGMDRGTEGGRIERERTGEQEKSQMSETIIFRLYRIQ